jgi:phosphoglycolate phosphatase
MLKLIVFDWDGTLANSVGKIIECKHFLAEKYNIPSPSEEVIKSVLGKKFEDAMSICFPTIPQNILTTLGREFHVLMQQDYFQASLFPNVKNVLRLLKEQGIKCAIATSKDRKELDRAIMYNQIIDMFDIACCGKEHQEKPDPAMLNYIMKKLYVRPNESMMIGDTTTDILFATNTGVQSIGVTFGAHPISLLQSLNPLALIDEWLELPKIIDKYYATQIEYIVDYSRGLDEWILCNPS